MDYDKYRSELTIDDLSDNHKELAELFGMDLFLDLTIESGGCWIYIPSAKETYKNLLYQKIISEYDGFNMDRLIVKYSISESTFRRLIKKRHT